MENLSPGAERRKDLRLGILTPVSIKINITQGKGILQLRRRKKASPRNISISGILLDSLSLSQHQMRRVVDGSDKLALELEIPYLKKPLRVTGKIIWSAKKDKHGKTTYEAGISFEDIREKDKEKLLPLLLSLCLKGKAKI
jgi:c-di-GMP-binding flagellar brake protein YcgR